MELDNLAAFFLALIAVATFIWEWVQRKWLKFRYVLGLLSQGTGMAIAISAINKFGTAFTATAVTATAINRGSGAVAGLQFLEQIPTLLLYVFGGTLVDAVPLEVTMVVSNTLLGVVAGLVAVAGVDVMPVMYTVYTTLGSVGALGTSNYFAAQLREYLDVQRQQLLNSRTYAEAAGQQQAALLVQLDQQATASRAFLQSSRDLWDYLSRLVAPLAAAWLYQYLGRQIAFIDAATFLIVAGLVVFGTSWRQLRQIRAQTNTTRLVAGARRAFAHVLRSRSAFFLIGISMIWGAWDVRKYFWLTPLVAAPALAFGYTNAAQTLGNLLAALASRRVASQGSSYTRQEELAVSGIFLAGIGVTLPALAAGLSALTKGQLSFLSLQLSTVVVGLGAFSWGALTALIQFGPVKLTTSEQQTLETVREERGEEIAQAEFTRIQQALQGRVQAAFKVVSALAIIAVKPLVVFGPWLWNMLAVAPINQDYVIVLISLTLLMITIAMVIFRREEQG